VCSFPLASSSSSSSSPRDQDLPLLKPVHFLRRENTMIGPSIVRCDADVSSVRDKNVLMSLRVP
jgi:hypothetical protein